MKHTIFLIIILMYFDSVKAQSVGIGTIIPDQSAQLDVNSTSKGFLPPRMTLLQRNNILNPVAGLVIWCTDCDELQVFNGIIWKNMSGTAASGVSLPSVKICNQVWTVKNLDVSNYKNGDPIPLVTNATAWVNLTTGAWCWYNNDSATYAATYGKLYNWYAVNDPRGLAPTGWHIPTDLEWSTLTNCLGGEAIAGGKMKSISGWPPPNTGATNSSGFTALPGGFRNFFGGFQFGDALWWSSTETIETRAWGRHIYNTIPIVSFYDASKLHGFSIRCVKD